MAWLVTLPELLATGLAVALTPPTSPARDAVGKRIDALSNTRRKYFNC